MNKAFIVGCLYILGGQESKSFEEHSVLELSAQSNSSAEIQSQKPETNREVPVEEAKPNFSDFLARIDNGEIVPLEEFSETIEGAIRAVLYSDHSLEKKVQDSLVLMHSIIFNKNDAPRFKEIESAYFKGLLKIVSNFAQDRLLDPFLRIRVAFDAASLFSAAIPESGLPVDDPHIKGTLLWHNYILDNFQEHSIRDPKVYLSSCLYVSGIYQRRAQKRYPDIPLDVDNPFIEKAITYLERGVYLVVNSEILSFDEGNDYLGQLATMRCEYLPATIKGEHPYVKDTVEAYRRWRDHADSPPNKKQQLYISMSTAMKELDLAVAKQKALETGDPSDLQKAQDLGKEYIEDAWKKGLLMWNRGEKYAARRASAQASEGLRELCNRFSLPYPLSFEEQKERAEASVIRIEALMAENTRAQEALAEKRKAKKGKRSTNARRSAYLYLLELELRRDLKKAKKGV